MSMKCLLNNDIIEESEAKISPFDRGYLFADGIYEVMAIVDGMLLDANKHWDRLIRSCNAIDLPLPMDLARLKSAILNLVDINNLKEGRVYLQITRGVAERDFVFPQNASPQLFAFVRQADVIDPDLARNGISAITVEDLRWKRRDIKSIALLPQTMAKQMAHKAGAGEAIMVENGLITEGSSSTIHMIKNGVLISRPLSYEVLAGVTRHSIFSVAERLGIKVEESALSVEEAYNADELFLTSASAIIHGIIKLNDQKIADGKVGKITRELRKAYLDHSILQAKNSI